MLAAVVLAAGESRRMGAPKALLPFSGRPFLAHLLEVARHPRIGLTRVVLGAGADDILRKVPLDPAIVVVNSEWQQGQLSSIQAGLRSLPDGLTEGALFCLVDHPLISAHLVAELINQFDRGPRRIVIPTYLGKRGHPAIFPSHLYPELLAAPADVGARAVVWAHSREVLEMPTDEQGVVLNLNDPEAFRKVIESDWPAAETPRH